MCIHISVLKHIRPPTVVTPNKLRQNGILVKNNPDNNGNGLTADDGSNGNGNGLTV